jgi:hypothetical protein
MHLTDEGIMTDDFINVVVRTGSVTTQFSLEVVRRAHSQSR